MDWHWFWTEVFRIVIELATMWTLWGATWLSYREGIDWLSFCLLVPSIIFTFGVAKGHRP